MPTINDEHSTPAPRKRRRNIRTLPANQMEYLLANYPATTDAQTIRATEKSGDTEVWFRDDVLRAMQAAFNAGKRAAKREE